jgi:hypothetical protein
VVRVWRGAGGLVNQIPGVWVVGVLLGAGGRGSRQSGRLNLTTVLVHCFTC